MVMWKRAKKVWPDQPEDYEGLDVHQTYFQLLAYPLNTILFLIYSIAIAIIVASIDTGINGALSGVVAWFVMFFIVPYAVGAIAVLCFDAACKTWTAVFAHFRAVCCKGGALVSLKVMREETQTMVRLLMLTLGSDDRQASDEYKTVRRLSASPDFVKRLNEPSGDAASEVPNPPTMGNEAAAEIEAAATGELPASAQ